ncbi:hypothetical protein HDU76_000935 [Blyttiomyces sp. JEL0837]|nr:hypothetical protein HDU76_000935 [Blyttiomyces sp. JEL0837]
MAMNAISLEYDPQEAELVKKLDQRLIPILVTAYWLALVDRSALDYAHRSLQNDLHIKDWQYVLCLAGYFFGSLPLIFPSTYLFRYVNPRRNLIAWGFISCLMGSVKHWESLFALRILFGAAQAGFMSGIILYLSNFYTREERTVRLTLVIGIATCASAFSPAFARTLENFDGMWSMSGWRWMFLMEGLPSIAMGVIIYFFLPDFPETIEFVTPADRLVAANRVRDEDDPDPRVHQVKRPTSSLTSPTPLPYQFHKVQIQDIFNDIHFYLFTLTYVCIAVGLDALLYLAPLISAGTFTNGSGVTEWSLDAALVAIAPYGVAAGCAIAVAYRSDRTGDRGIHVGAALALATLGFAVIALVPETNWTPVSLANGGDNGGGGVGIIANLTSTGGVVSGMNSSISWHSNHTHEPSLNTSWIGPSGSRNGTRPNDTLFGPGGSKTKMSPSASQSPSFNPITNLLVFNQSNNPIPPPSGPKTPPLPVNTITKMPPPPPPKPTIPPPPPPKPTSVDISAENNEKAEKADIAAGGDGGVTAGALRYFFGLLPAAVGLLCALPSLLALTMDRAHGATARETAAATVTALGPLGNAVIVPWLFPPSKAPEDLAEGIATWGIGYGFGAGLCAVACVIGCIAAFSVRWLTQREASGTWGKSPGLRRLLNDVEEKGAWDDVGESIDQLDADGDIGGGWGGVVKSGGYGGESEWDLSQRLLCRKG